MAKKLDTTSTVTLVLNGQQSQTSLRDITSAVNSLRTSLSNMRQEDNPELYRQRIAELQRMTAAQREMRQEIMGSTEAQKGFFDAFKDGFAEMAGNITAASLIFQGIEAGISFVKDLWNGSEAAYDEATRAQTQLQAAVKSTGGVAGESNEKLQKYQQTLMDLTGVDDDVIAKGEEMLLTFTNIRGKIYEQALPAIVDMTAAMNGGKVGMEGIQATSIQVGKALNDPIAGMTKLQKVGVTFSEQQKEQVKNFQDTNQIAKAQAIIINELNKEFGGTAKAIADTDIGKIQAFETSLGNLQERIGAFIIELKGKAADFWGPLVKSLADARTEAEILTDEFYKQKKGVEDLQKNTVPLIDRYDELKSKSKLNKDEQIELNGIISSLSQTIPGAVTQWDKYGKAMGINTDKARDFIKVQQAMLKIQNKDAIDETESLIKDLEGRSGRIQSMLAAGTKVVGGQRAGNSDRVDDVKTRKLTDQEILAASKELGEIQTKIKDAQDGIKGLKGENIPIPDNTPVPDATTEASAADRAAAEAKRQKAIKDKAEYAASVAALVAKLKEFNQAELADTLAKYDKEIAALENKYNKEWTEDQAGLIKLRANKYHSDEELDKQQAKVDALAGQKKAAVNALRIRQEKELTEALAAFRDKMRGKMETELQKETDAINREYDQRVKNAGTNQQMIDEIETSRAGALADAKISEQKRFQDAKDQVDAEGAVSAADKDKVELARINKKYDAEIEALKNKFSQELQATQAFQDLIDKINGQRKAEADKVTVKDDTDKKKKTKDTAIDSAQSVANAVFEIGKNNRAAETDAKINELEKQKDIELSKKNLTEAQKKAINDKYAKQEAAIKLQQWQADKDAALESAVINGALAIVKALPNPFAAIAAGVAAASQIAVIAGSKPPKFGKGGVIDGPSHSAGGVPLINGHTGQQVAEVEGDETLAVFSAATTRNNKMLINELLYNGWHRNGAPVKVNTAMAIKATPQYLATGGYINVAGTGKQYSSSNTGTASASELAETNALLAGLHQQFANFANKPWEFPMRAFQENQAKLDQITNKANPK